MANPQHRGEFDKLYYQIGDYDIETQSDAEILADDGWIEFCVVDVSIPKARSTNEINDRCSPELKVYTSGKRDISVTVNLNEIRHDIANLKAWHTAIDAGEIFALLILNDERTEAEAWGWVGNFITEQNDENQPQEGDNTESLTFKPSAATEFTPVVRRIYGSGIPDAS